jgi:voltage-gated sodium channel
MDLGEVSIFPENMRFLKQLLLNDFVILAFIVLNALAIFFSGYPLEANVRHAVEWIDAICTIVFLAEAAVKLNTLGRKNYFESGWNTFDFLLVAISTPQLILWFTGAAVDSLGFVLVFRLFRIFRIFRLIKFIPDVHKIINGAKRAIKASSLILVVFLIFNFIIGIVSFNLFSNLAPEHFANPHLSIYSIFKIFTVEGWYEIPDTIAAGSDPWVGMAVRFYFINLLFIGGIFGLSLINSIFVDNMVADNNDEVEARITQLEKKIDRITELLEKKQV